MNLGIKGSLVLFLLGAAAGCSTETSDGAACHTDGSLEDPDNGGDADGGPGGPGGDGDTGGGTGDSGTTLTPPTGEWESATANLAGLDSECGNMSGFSAKPDENLLIAGIAQKGLWASDDGGKSWQALGSAAGSDPITNRMSSIVYDPTDTGRFWQTGIYGGGGVYETNDGGETFDQRGDVSHIDLVSIDFSDPDRKVMVAGGHEIPQTLHRSDDGGSTWKSIGAGLPSNVSCTWPLVVDANTYLVGCSYSGEGIYRSTDAGQTWSLVSQTGGSRAPLRASDDSLYWSIANNGGLMRSTDDGKTWTQVTGPSVVTSTTPLELPDGRLAMLGISAVLSSGDKGATWQAVSTQLPYGDASGLAYSVQQKAFFVWHFTCGFNGPVPVPDDAIMRYDYDYETP